MENCGREEIFCLVLAPVRMRRVGNEQLQEYRSVSPPLKEDTRV